MLELRHPLPKMQDFYQGSLHVYGPQDSKHLIIMCAGYPDNQSPFSTIASRLATECNCLVGVTCLPGYDDSIPLEMYPHEGYNFTDWPVSLREAVKCLRTYSTQPTDQTTFTAVFHDWGVLAGCMYTNQCLAENNKEDDSTKDDDIYTPDRVVFVDLLPLPGRNTPGRFVRHDNTTPYQKFSRIFYMAFLAIQFRISRFLPFVFVLSFFGVGSLVCELLNVYPISSHDKLYFRDHIPMKSKSDLQRLWYLAYPYKCMIELALQGKMDKNFVQECYSMPSDLTRTPVMHILGKSKRYSLSDANGLLQLQHEESCGRPSRVVEVDDAGHWCYVTQPDVCFKAFQSFFDACGIDH